MNSLSPYGHLVQAIFQANKKLALFIVSFSQLNPCCLKRLDCRDLNFSACNFELTINGSGEKNKILIIKLLMGATLDSMKSRIYSLWLYNCKQIIIHLIPSLLIHKKMKNGNILSLFYHHFFFFFTNWYFFVNKKEKLFSSFCSLLSAALMYYLLVLVLIWFCENERQEMIGFV